MRRRFLLVGLDGVRADALERARTPVIDRIAASGYLRTARIPTSTRTMSGAMWASILTGVWADRHGVTRNWLPSRRLARHPDVLQRAAQLLPAGSVFGAVTWPPLAIRTGCGPILRHPAYLPTRHPGVSSGWRRADALVLHHALERLAEPSTAAGFVYLGTADMVAHERGAGASYTAAIEREDAQIGELLAALDARPDRDEWLVLVTTDHGHRDRGGHGGRTEAEETVWFAADRRAPGWDAYDSAGIAGHLLDWVGADS